MELIFICAECDENPVDLNLIIGNTRQCYDCYLKEYEECNNIGKKLCNRMECKYCFYKSFASNIRAKNWSRQNEKSPREIMRNTNYKFLFDCKECLHTFEITPYNITNRNSWCRYCAIPSRILCNDIKCDHCFNRSFASHPKAKYWNFLKNEKSPREVFKLSHIKYWFICDICSHTFDSTLGNITSKNSWCPYCAGNKLCPDECDHCFNKSFASHPRAKNWNYSKNNKTPREVFLFSHDKYWFDCDICSNTFNMCLCHVSNNVWCPACKNKTENKLFEFFKTIIPSIIFQFNPEWCINSATNKKLPFDFCDNDNKIIIELDGKQHFEDMKCWYSISKDVSDRDIHKMKQALENNYSLIRIIQQEIYKDKYNYKTILPAIIKLCKKDPGIYLVSVNNNLYENHINKIKESILDVKIITINPLELQE